MRKIIVGSLALSISLALFVAVYTALNHTPAVPIPSAYTEVTSPIPATPDSILAAVNTERAKVGIAPLAMHPVVTKAAQWKADDMWTKNYRSHYLPGYGDQKATITKELSDEKYPICIHSGENYVYDTNNQITTTEQALNWWMNSPSHKAAILDPKYTLTGIGIAGNSLIVQHFCVAR